MGNTSKSSGGRRPLIRQHLRHRLLQVAAICGGIVFFALAVGVIGYHLVARLPWVDSVLNASMILTGMGPVDRMDTAAAKLFASAYALFSTLMFIGATSLLLSQVFHIVLHRFHLETQDAE